LGDFDIRVGEGRQERGGEIEWPILFRPVGDRHARREILGGVQAQIRSVRNEVSDHPAKSVPLVSVLDEQYIAEEMGYRLKERDLKGLGHGRASGDPGAVESMDNRLA